MSRILLQGEHLHLYTCMWRKFQKDAVSSVVLPHWSSFNWTLGLTVMMHSLTGGDRGPSLAGKLDRSECCCPGRWQNF